MNNQLRRSTTNKVIGGVAGGIAEAYNWDPTLVRLGFVVLTLTHGIGLMLYLALWLFMPSGSAATAGAVEPSAYFSPPTDRNRVLGYALLAVGGLILANVLHISVPVMAVALIAGGWYLLRRR